MGKISGSEEKPLPESAAQLAISKSTEQHRHRLHYKESLPGRGQGKGVLLTSPFPWSEPRHTGCPLVHISMTERKPQTRHTHTGGRYLTACQDAHSEVHWHLQKGCHKYQF